MFIFFDFATTKLLQIFGIYKVFCEKMTSVLAQVVFFPYCFLPLHRIPQKNRSNSSRTLSSRYGSVIEAISRHCRDNIEAEPRQSWTMFEISYGLFFLFVLFYRQSN